VGRKKEILREKWVGGWRWAVEKIFSIQKPLAKPLALKENNRRGTPNLNLEIDRGLRITEVQFLQEDRYTQHVRSHNNHGTQAFCRCLGHPSLYTK